MCCFYAYHKLVWMAAAFFVDFRLLYEEYRITRYANKQ